MFSVNFTYSFVWILNFFILFLLLLRAFFLRMEYTVFIKGGVARHEVARFVEPVSFELRKGENLAIVGSNGSGKSMLVDIIMGRYPLREGVLRYDFSPSESNAVYKNVRYIAFRDVYGGLEGGYYQQRWNSHDQEGIPTLRQLFGDNCDTQWGREVLQMLGLLPLLDSLIIMLSSGELRKFQVAKMLMEAPRLLIIDNPFIGLDSAMRLFLADMLEKIAAAGNVQLILLLTDADDIPSCIDRVVRVEGMKVLPAVERSEYSPLCPNATYSVEVREALSQLPVNEPFPNGSEMVELNAVTIKYGNRKILNNLDWRICSGEVWALSGENGSGKSTLLSLLCADNLQSYACDIKLFGRRRGSGESIWEIKKHIGYVSPEMHRSYLKNIPTIDIVASGLHDSIGLYVKSTPQQLRVCEWWLSLFGILHLKERSFMQLSSGEQRLALLARAFVKDPSLLILDEPLHGLDAENKRRVKAIVEEFSKRKGKSVIYVSHYEDEFPSTVTHRLHLVRN